MHTSTEARSVCPLALSLLCSLAFGPAAVLTAQGENEPAAKPPARSPAAGNPAAGNPAAGNQPAQGTDQLSRLITIARARAEAQRPVQLAKLAPYRNDLALEYRGEGNIERLEKVFDELATSGDAIAPILLENLTPKSDSPSDRNTAANSARILRRLDPGAFVDSLLEFATNKSWQTRRHAVELLGYTKSQRAATFLVERLDEIEPNLLPTAIDSLRRLGSRDAGGRVSPFLASKATKLRAAALAYLNAAGDPQGIDGALAALPGESSRKLISRYVEYLRTTATEHRAAATALVTLLGSEALNEDGRVQVARALATVSPRGDKPTMQALRALVDQSPSRTLARTAALSMKTAGDKSGVKHFFDRIRSELRENPRSHLPHFHRATLQRALGNHRQALRDYDDAVRRARSSKVEEFLRLRMAACAGEAGNFSRALKELKAAMATYRTIQREARSDPGLAKALEAPAVKRWLRSLEPEDG